MKKDNRLLVSYALILNMDEIIKVTSIKLVNTCIVSIFYCVLYVLFVSNCHIRSKLLTEYYWV